MSSITFFIARYAIVLAMIIPLPSWAVLLPRGTVPITSSAEVSSTTIVDGPQVDSTCLPYTPGVLVLEAWGTSASSFCTSWEPITTVIVTVTTSTTSTVVASASTTTASTIRTITTTASPRTVYSTTVTATAAVTANSVGTARRCTGAQKRDLTETVPVPTASSPSTDPSPSMVTLPANAPTDLSAFPSSYIVSACECLHLPTPTSTTTTTVVERTTTTPVTTYTPSTTVTTVSTVTTASTVTVPGGVLLAHPTPLTNNDANGYVTSEYDDNWFSATLPFPLYLYGQNSSTVTMGINGWITISGDPIGRYVNYPLPAAGLPKVSFVAYWSDLLVHRGTKQGLYYQIDGSPGSRIAYFEWYTTTSGNTVADHNFIASFYENSPGAVTYDYYQVALRQASTDSALGTVGVQRFDTNQYAQYSYNNTAPVTSNMRVIYSPSSNDFSVQLCS